MPVPWSETSTIIAEVENRAITLHQLHDLFLFIQRLCKVGLLKDQHGNAIQIFNINMYFITDLIIKPVISFVEKRRGTNRKFSWVEFVAQGPQKPHLLFSHAWDGRFRDFMSIVDLVARNNALSTSVAVWICTFAVSQFGENFGAGLRDCPFYKAIKAAMHGTLLVVDRGSSSLQRIWCGFELHVTMLQDKPLQVYTSMGQVGVAVTSGRLVEAIESFDVKCMEASQPSDRRQILNFLSGGELHEKDGLKVDASLNLELINGWQKQLLDDTSTDAVPLRRNGCVEFTHEANLFTKHSDKFEAFNEGIRGKVMAAANLSVSCKATTGFKTERMDERGVTLAEIRAFAKQVKVWCSSSDRKFESVLVEDVIELFIKPSSTETLGSYAEQCMSAPRVPRYFIDEVYKGSFQDLMSSLEWFAEAQGLLDETVFYVFALCMDFTVQDWDKHWEALATSWDAVVDSILTNCEGWLSILAEGEELIVRSNRMQQLQICFQRAKRIYFGCKDGVLACTAPFPNFTWIFGVFDVNLAHILVHAKWEEARCGSERARANINKIILESRGGFASFNARVARVAMGPLLANAARLPGSEGLAAIQSVSSRPGFLINSAVLKGPFGETAVHIAAAEGNLEVLRFLLDLHADANAEDHIRETPLHYAAFSGKLGSIQMLLKYGAEPKAESAFAEDVIFVAEQNPALYLGIETHDICTLLWLWDKAAS